MKLCILCGEELSKYPTNREHFFGQVILRNLSKLGVKDSFSHALRVDECEDQVDAVLTGRGNHYDYATVLAHIHCNQNDSKMCVALKHLIDNIDRPFPRRDVDLITAYYGKIWRMDPESITVTRIDPRVSSDMVCIYRPGRVWAGKILINVEDGTKVFCPSNEQLTIYLGTKKRLEQFLGI